MHNVEVRHNAPEAVDLGVIPHDFRANERRSTNEDGDAECKHEGIRLGIDLLQAMDAGAIVKELLGQRVELGKIGLDGLVVVCAVAKGSEHGENHGGQSIGDARAIVV